jgi:hypothetical protein
MQGFWIKQSKNLASKFNNLALENRLPMCNVFSADPVNNLAIVLHDVDLRLIRRGHDKYHRIIFT